MATHTKAPWKLLTGRMIDLESRTKRTVIIGPKGEHIALVDGISAQITSEDELLANGHLISAAPELLEALEAASQVITFHSRKEVRDGRCYDEGGEDECGARVLRLIEAAIAKARGV